MKFLSKKADSEILKASIVYLKNRPKNNKDLKEVLIKEQYNFCAYTEKYIQELDSIEVEHFNASKKYNDDYYNYYAVTRKANLYKRKKENKHSGATFFNTLFFQDERVFNSKIKYIEGSYEEVDEDDQEAKDLIDFLDFNNHHLYTDRRRHISRLEKSFNDASYSNEERIEYFRCHPEELSFITAIEIELGLDLSEFYS